MPDGTILEQGSPAWLMQRLGKATASRIADLMAETKSGFSASRANYLAELVVQRLTGTIEPGFTNAAMQRGTDCEPQARALYAFVHDVDVIETGFWQHPSIPAAGASPDGLVGGDGLVEIKCPTSATHLATLRGAGIPDKYMKQMQFQLACTGRSFCDFASFDPRVPADLQLHVRRVPRDDALIRTIEKAVRDFLVEVDRAVLDLRPAEAHAAALAAFGGSVAGAIAG
jgi:putative phage-type endonuclease